MTRSLDPLTVFESHRRDLVLLAYRMLGDMGRAEDMVQEAWMRWSRVSEDAESPRAYLLAIVTRLCLNELDSARARKEESRSDRLPEPIATSVPTGHEQLETLDHVSMALLYVLQCLTPAERAVLLLHDVFDLEHAEVAKLVGKSVVASRKLLERARQRVAKERPTLTASRDEHRRLLDAFVRAATAGDTEALVHLPAEDATIVTDGGLHGQTTGGVRNLAQPLDGPARIAAFVAAATQRNGGELHREERELNGQPALVFSREGKVFAALLLAVGGLRRRHRRPLRGRRHPRRPLLPRRPPTPHLPRRP
jgi:RNA polymerase sigma-70 factor (ECF subfamily)